MTASEDGFRLLVEQVVDYAIFLVDTSGRVTTWNAGAQRIKGYTAAEIVGQTIERFYRPEDAWKVPVELEAATVDGRVEDEGWRVRKGGALFWANVIITALRDEQGQLVGFAKVTRDLTERRRAEAALRASEDRFGLLVAGVRDHAIFMLDPRGFITSWNAGAERIKGYSEAEIIGQHLSRFYTDEDARGGACERDLARAASEGHTETDAWRMRKDGSRFWANVVLTALRDASGALVGYAKITRDLTERLRAEQERLRRATEATARTSADRVLALLTRLQGLTGALAAAHTPADVTTILVDQGRLALGAAAALVVAPIEGQLQVLASRGAYEGLLAASHESVDARAPAATALRTGSPMWLESEADYLREAVDLPLDAGVARSVAALPLVVRGEVVAVMAFRFDPPQTFAADERALMENFAGQAGQALDRAQVYARELTTRRRVESLSASLSTTLRSIGDAVIATDTSGTITFMNAVAESLTGWRETEARGRPMVEVFHVVDELTRAPVASPVDEVLPRGKVVGMASHALLLARDGREIAIEDRAAPIQAAGGGPVEGVVVVFRDVSAKRREDSRRAFLEDATVALVESLDYEVTLSNVALLAVPRLADWCAVDLAQEGTPKPRRVAVAHVDPAKIELARELDVRYPPPDDAPSGVPNVLRTGKSELYPEIPDALLEAGCVDAEHLRLARALQLRSAMIVPLLARGRVLGAMSFVFAESRRLYAEDDLAFAEDLARRCALAIDNARLFASEQQARQSADVANRSKDEFLAVVSHELRTPLNAILGWARIMSAPSFDAARRGRAIETIARNALAMAQLIEDLLDISRIISGKMRLEVQAVDLVPVVEAALDSIRPAADAREIQLAATLDSTLPQLVGDPARLQQIAWNLLSNAVKFTPRGGRVDVTYRRDGSWAELTVSDTGKGIAATFLPHVFDPFRQEDASFARSRGGLGLGLAISRQLVELHGGRIEARSDGDGKGATFVVCLPIAGATRTAASQPGLGVRRIGLTAEVARPPALRGLRVLVVDDEEDARELVRTILESCGCVVRVAGSVDEALAAFALEIPDILLSDIGMPGRDGYELIHRIRALPAERGGEVAAAALTAYARTEDRRRLLDAGYSMHLPKPVEPAELLAVVESLTRFALHEPATR